MIGWGETKSGSPMPSEITSSMVAAISKKRRMPDGGTERIRSERRPARRSAVSRVGASMATGRGEGPPSYRRRGSGHPPHRREGGVGHDLTVVPAVRVPVRSVLVLAAALAGTGAVVAWVSSMGGPAAFRGRFGPWAPAVTVPLHVLTTLTPVGEVVPFGVANGALYGLGAGALLNWGAWMTAAALQYAFGRSAAREAAGSRPPAVPAFLRRLRLTHPLVLTCGRWLPGGGPLVDAAAGAAGLPFHRAMAFAALGHAPQAVAIAAVGAGLVRLGG